MTRGVLLMAYGTPETPDDIAPYYTHIRGGREPSAEAIERLARRYEIVGGRTPLLEITSRVREALERELNVSPFGERYHVYIGMKHWHPFIADVIPVIANDGVSDLIAIALAPHYSRMSIGGYQSAVEAAIGAIGHPIPVRFIRNWHMKPGFIELIAQRVRESLTEWPEPARAQVVTVFSAHSLPERIREWGDPYEQQLLESCHAVAKRAGIDNWRFAWQSAGETGEKWLGPDIGEVLETLYSEGARHVLSVPIGFVSDHLEILYDIDYEARQKADALGVTLRRTRMPNVDPAFIKVLASIVTESTQTEAEALAS
jgi:protoporphyrin/coproporphyrin ferrochelatase